MVEFIWHPIQMQGIHITSQPLWPKLLVRLSQLIWRTIMEMARPLTKEHHRKILHSGVGKQVSVGEIIQYLEEQISLSAIVFLQILLIEENGIITLPLPFPYFTMVN